MRKILTYLFLLSLCIGANAQQLPKPGPCDSAITFIQKRHSTDYFSAGQRLSFDRVSDRLMRFPQSAGEFKLYRQRSNIGLIAMYVGLGIYIAGAILRGTNRQAYNQNISNISLGYLATTAGGLTFLIVSKKNFKRSLDYYNRQICLRPLP